MPPLSCSGSRYLAVSAAAILLTAVLTPGRAFAADKMITDDSLKRMVREDEGISRSHGLMMEQRERLHVLLDAFLAGDAAVLDETSQKIAKSMQGVIVTAELPPEEEAIVWNAISQVVVQSRFIQSAVQEKDYRRAYDHYSVLVSQCVQCHQVARGWGKFEELTMPPDPPAKTRKNGTVA